MIMSSTSHNFLVLNIMVFIIAHSYSLRFPLQICELQEKVPTSVY